MVSYTMFLKKKKMAKEKKYNTYDNYVTLSKENATQIWYKEYKLFEKGNFARMQFRLLNREHVTGTTASIALPFKSIGSVY